MLAATHQAIRCLVVATHVHYHEFSALAATHK
jgi:hypothetical protein